MSKRQLIDEIRNFNPTAHPQFLAQFGLKDLRELPRREDLLLEPPQPVVQQAAEAPAPEGGPS